MTTPFLEDNDQTRARREHLQSLREMVGNVYPNKFERSRNVGREDTITAILERFRPLEPQVKEGEQRPGPEEIERANAELNKIEVRIAGGAQSAAHDPRDANDVLERVTDCRRLVPRLRLGWGIVLLDRHPFSFSDKSPPCSGTIAKRAIAGGCAARPVNGSLAPAGYIAG